MLGLQISDEVGAVTDSNGLTVSLRLFNLYDYCVFVNRKRLQTSSPAGSISYRFVVYSDTNHNKHCYVINFPLASYPQMSVCYAIRDEYCFATNVREKKSAPLTRYL